MHANNHTLELLRQLAAESPVIMNPLREEFDKAVSDNDPKLAKRIEEVGQFLFGDSWVTNG